MQQAADTTVWLGVHCAVHITDDGVARWIGLIHGSLQLDQAVHMI